jgi:hypothetical protein
LTFTLGAYLPNWLGAFFNYLAGLGKVYIENPLLQSMVVSGIIEGAECNIGFAPCLY